MRIDRGVGQRARRRIGRGTRLADRADKYALYEQCVQSPDVDVTFFDRVFRTNFKRRPETLREDFCGTAAICCEWIRRNRKRRAWGVDLDPEPLAWSARNHLRQLSEPQRARVHLLEGDVRECTTPPVDIVIGMNFSFCVFRTRDELRRYFVTAYRNLDRTGVFIVDMFGGYETMEDDHEVLTEYPGFTYIWEQVRFDPITHHGRYRIHFRFRDKSAISPAFSYDWRVWTIPEVREVMAEAGFARTDVYWEDTDAETGEGNGVYRRRTHGESDPAWNAYVVGVK